MSEYQTTELSAEKFLTVASNVLYQCLITAQRADAKNIFNALSEGKRVALMKLRMEDETEVRVDLNFDSTEFIGKLNFSGFRSSLEALIASIGAHIEAEKEITTFNDQYGASILYGIPGITQEGETVNVMMLSADPGTAGVLGLKLMYMEPGQFFQPQAEQA